MPATTNKPSLLEEHFKALSEDDEQSVSGSDVPSEDDLENTDGKSKKKSQVPRSDVLSLLMFLFNNIRLLLFYIYSWLVLR